jgi:hypothetical protein
MKLAINNKDLTDCFFEDCRLLGIMAPIRNYQFCWHLNSLLGLDFRINNEIEIQLNKKNRNYFFGVYEFHEPASSLSHYVYSNHFDGEFLLPELKHLDFLWLMKGDPVQEELLQQLANSVRMINGVQLVVELTNEKIRNKEHLIF